MSHPTHSILDIDLEREFLNGSLSMNPRPFGISYPDCLSITMLESCHCMHQAKSWAKTVESFGLDVLLESHAHVKGLEVDYLRETVYERNIPWLDETFGGVIARGPHA